MLTSEYESALRVELPVKLLNVPFSKPRVPAFLQVSSCGCGHWHIPVACLGRALMELLGQEWVKEMAGWAKTLHSRKKSWRHTRSGTWL